MSCLAEARTLWRTGSKATLTMPSTARPNFPSVSWHRASMKRIEKVWQVVESRALPHSVSFSDSITCRAHASLDEGYCSSQGFESLGQGYKRWLWGCQRVNSKSSPSHAAKHQTAKNLGSKQAAQPAECMDVSPNKTTSIDARQLNRPGPLRNVCATLLCATCVYACIQACMYAHIYCQQLHYVYTYNISVCVWCLCKYISYI